MTRAAFLVTPHFEACYALAALAEAAPPIHGAWCAGVGPRLGLEVRRTLEAYGSLLWNTLSDLPGAVAPGDDLAPLVTQLRDGDPALFQSRVLVGILHVEAAVEALIAGRRTLPETFAALPEAKREWLAYIGLFPHAPEAPASILVRDLVERPEAVRAAAAAALEAFWEAAFAATWSWLAPQLQRARDRAERLYASADLGEFLRELRLLVELDESAGTLVALRGGYRIALADLEGLIFLPSAFNHRRFWTSTADAGGRPRAVFPFFDPAIELDLPRRAAAASLVAPLPAQLPALDPALVCKALGDATRFSMLKLLAAQPRSSAALAAATGLSKPTISHHVFQLRAAGLLAERSRGKAVELSVERAALEALSDLLIAGIFEDDDHQETATGSMP